MPLISHPVRRPLSGRVTVPGDKSISHRAVILASLAEGISTISGWLNAEDTQATLAACVALGARVEWRQQNGNQLLTIIGTGGELITPDKALDLGNSGTGVRLLLGAVAGQKIKVTFTGDSSLRQRPMGRIVEPLQQMGAGFVYQGHAVADHAVRLPLQSLGPVDSSRLKAIDYRLPVASAQVQAAILLAGLRADGTVRIHQPGPCRDHSERILRLFNAQVTRQDANNLIIRPSILKGCNVDVPGDFSSAAFLLQAALLVPGASVQLAGVGVNPSRTGLLEVISSMGGKVGIKSLPVPDLAEPVAELNCRHHELKGIDVPEYLVSNCIDEFPMIMAIAATCKGNTRIRGAAELRVKESDRIAVMATALQQLGVTVKEFPDGVDITGGSISGGDVDAHGDHRIAMSLAVLGLVAARPVCIHNAQAIATSYPGFTDDLNSLGAQLQWSA